MKNKYPDYRKNKLLDVKKKLPKETQKLIDEFLEYCKITAGLGSILKIESKIIQIADILEKPLNDLSLKDLQEFLVLLNRSGRSIETQNDTKKIFKRFLRWKYKDWSKKFNEFRDLRTKDGMNYEKLNAQTILDSEDLELAIRSAESLKWKAWITLTFESAGRPEEILNSKWKDLDLNKKEIKLHSHKTGRTRVIPLDECIIHLERYKREYPYLNVMAEDYLFPSPNNRKEPISLQSVHDFLRDLEKKTGIKKHLFPYIFRHTRLTELHKKLSPKVYEMFAGHSMEVATKRYAHMNLDDVRNEMLSKVYHIEELTKQDKGTLEKLQKDMTDVQKAIAKINKIIAGFPKNTSASQ